ncbi:MAG: hypothetical protein A3F09_04170 [Chlamydiae bacterium RIFCSPHIGHO2_12_FULL_49_11]|nr:MAG: hypothetical protein A3F09_04170 [Chlamydiae bacterium RIFCSPHIGHO2_12_FULL_49_11]
MKLLWCACVTCFLFGEKTHDYIFYSINPKSCLKLLTYSQLFPDDPCAPLAMQKALELINLHRDTPITLKEFRSIPYIDLFNIVSLFAKQPYLPFQPLEESEIAFIEKLCNGFENRRLKGHYVWTENDLVSLDTTEIDLSRALFIYEFRGDQRKIRSYEAMLDIMALEILGKVDKNATQIEKIDAINRFIFYDMRFRFPPRSMWTFDDSAFTFLPSVMDSRHGVCLGVSILYLTLAQRLSIPLSIITPPGHIFVAYRENGLVRNIETTARGIHLPDSRYESITTAKIPERTIKQVIGANFYNAAGSHWKEARFDKALEYYTLAEKYFGPHDPALTKVKAYVLIALNKRGEALEEIEHYMQSGGFDTHPDLFLTEYKEGRLSSESLRLMIQDEFETLALREEFEKKLIAQTEVDSRSASLWFNIALCRHGLGKKKQALEALYLAEKIDAKNPILEYYLAMLNFDLHHPEKALAHLQKSLSLLQKGSIPEKIVLKTAKSYRAIFPFLSVN